MSLLNPELQQSQEEVPPFQGSQGKPRIPLKTRLGRLPVVRQQSSTDCGVACIAMVSQYYGKYFSTNHLREQLHSYRSGASMLNVVDVATQLGFETEAMMVTYEHLQQSLHPAIINWKGYHWLVVYKVSDTDVVVADPSDGQLMTLSREEFIEDWTHYVVYLVPTESFYQVPESKPTLENFRTYIRPYQRVLIEILVAALILQCLSLMLPLFSKFIIDEIIIKQDERWLTELLVGKAGVSFLFLVMNFLQQNLLLYVSMKINLSIINDFYQHLIHLPLPFFQNRKAGDITSRFQENEKITAFFLETGLQSFLNVFTAVMYLCIMFYFNTSLSLVACSFLSIHAFVIYFVTPYLQASYRDVFQKGADTESYLIESLHGRSTIKHLAIENRVRWHWEHLYVRFSNAYFRTLKYGVFSGLASGVVSHLSDVAILFYGALMVMHRQMTIGELVAYIAFMKGASTPIMQLIRTWDTFQETLNAVERLNDVFEKDVEQPPSTSKAPLLKPTLHGHILIKDLTFRYEGRHSKNILQNIQLEIQPGERIGIVGRSGSGKSSLVRLLAGFYTPSEGQIFFDGIPTSQLDIHHFRQQVGFVLQEIHLFSGTIRDNIAMGNPNASFAEVIKASKAAQVHEFINQMPQSYSTQMDESGTNLSGGQAQRIAIARVLLQNPKVLILDEATASLDSDNEHQIYQNLRTLLPDTTMIVISHRLSSIRHVDRIIVLDQGHILEQGSHEALMQQRGLYYHLNQQHLSL